MCKKNTFVIKGNFKNKNCNSLDFVKINLPKKQMASQKSKVKVWQSSRAEGCSELHLVMKIRDLSSAGVG
jgi:hypothetical protein